MLGKRKDRSNNTVDSPLIERLAEKATSGDSEALLELCCLVSKNVLFRTTHILNDRMDAEDAAQEVLIRVCKNIKDLKEPKAFNAWLGSIVVNESRRQMVKDTKHKEVVQIADYLESVEEEDVELIPQEYLERMENRKAMLDAIDTLPTRQREAVILHYFDGLNVKETAGAMGITIQNASRYLQLARTKIRTILEQQEVWEQQFDARRGLASRAASLPFAAVLTEVLQMECEAFVPQSEAWKAQALATCENVVASSAPATSRVMRMLLTAMLGALATVVAATGIIALVTLQQAEPSDVSGEVIYLGGDADCSYLNPTQAMVHVQTNQEELTLLGWEITAIQGEEVLYKGQEPTVEAPFVHIREDRLDGEYMLIFTFIDGIGRIHRLGHNFVSQTG